jgi:hypothetical protein
MNIVFDITLWVGALLLGGWWCTVIILPLFFGAPRALYLSIKGILKFRSCFIYIGTFLLWNIVFIVVAFIALRIAPETVWSIASDPVFTIGQLCGVGFVLMRSLTRQGRKQLSEDFEIATSRYRVSKND